MEPDYLMQGAANTLYMNGEPIAEIHELEIEPDPLGIESVFEPLTGTLSLRMPPRLIARLWPDSRVARNMRRRREWGPRWNRSLKGML